MGINNIELRHMRYFIAVAEELHFRRAAERLNIAQPALSRSIRQIEDALETQLFERTKRSVNLTAAGENFLQGCRTVLEATQSVIDETKLVASGQIGSLRIGYTDFAISARLPRLLTQFQKEYPGIVLQPHHGVTGDQLQRLKSGKIDIGFVTGPVSLPGMDTALVQSEGFVCVVYDEHPFAKRTSIKLQELADEKFVLGPAKEWEYFYYNLFPLCKKAGFMPLIVQEAYNSAAILSLVAGRMGITILTEGTATLNFEGLVSVPISDIEDKLETIAVWRKDKLHSATRSFVEFLNRSS